MEQNLYKPLLTFPELAAIFSPHRQSLGNAFKALSKAISSTIPSLSPFSIALHLQRAYPRLSILQEPIKRIRIAQFPLPNDFAFGSRSPPHAGPGTLQPPPPTDPASPQGASAAASKSPRPHRPSRSPPPQPPISSPLANPLSPQPMLPPVS
ncbi:hypothetical protein AAG906_038332 [Vitis piasezkii]